MKILIALILALTYVLLDVLVGQYAWNSILVHFVPVLPKIGFGQAALIGMALVCLSYPTLAAADLDRLKDKAGKLTRQEQLNRLAHAIGGSLGRLSVIYIITLFL